MKVFAVFGKDEQFNVPREEKTDWEKITGKLSDCN